MSPLPTSQWFSTRATPPFARSRVGLAGNSATPTPHEVIVDLPRSPNSRRSSRSSSPLLVAGDIATTAKLLAPDVVLVSDGGASHAVPCRSSERTACRGSWSTSPGATPHPSRRPPSAS